MLLLATLAVSVWVPVGMSPSEATDRHPDVRFVQYDGDSVPMQKGDILVILNENERPDRFKHALAVSDLERRIIHIFIKDLRKYLRGVPEVMIQTAIDRILAHEIEHLSRGSITHDKDGWFKSCISRESLTR